MVLKACLLAVLSLLTLPCNLSSAFLIGTLSRSIEDPELLTIFISNPNYRYVSILKHNTIFDIGHPSRPFQVTDEDGHRIRTGGSSALYSGIAKGDLFDFAPGTNFTRQLNITEYICLEHQDTEAPHSVTISLPSEFHGVDTHDGFYEIPPEASGRSHYGQLRMGETSKANLTVILLQSSPLRVTLSATQFGAPLRKRQSEDIHGIRLLIDKVGNCTAEQLWPYRYSIRESAYHGFAGIDAASLFYVLPFSYFFQTTIEASNTVARAMGGVVGAFVGEGPGVLAHCNDRWAACGDPSDVSKGPIGYVAQLPGFLPQIVMCPQALTLPANPPPCTAAPGLLSRGSAFMYLMLNIDAIAGTDMKAWYRPQGIQSARAIHNDVLTGKDTSKDLAAVSMMPSWSFDLGWGGSAEPMPYKGNPCMERWASGRFDSNIPGFPPSFRANSSDASLGLLYPNLTLSNQNTTLLLNYNSTAFLASNLPALLDLNPTVDLTSIS
ncbi:hypothetical protein MMC20_008048 [Loxospora ochrophaea]|nr:hypothetical protein [Loxospora ochrophaea]